MDFFSSLLVRCDEFTARLGPVARTRVLDPSNPNAAGVRRDRDEVLIDRGRVLDANGAESGR